MSSQGPLPYLSFCGVEVANAARTIEYLRRGLGNTSQGRWELGHGDLCEVLYRTQGTSPISTHFISPAADPAPWYDLVEPGASKFLGLFLLALTGYDSTQLRVVTPRTHGLGGGHFSDKRRNPRVWKFRGAMISADDSGAEYGLRWLTGILQSSACDTCSTCDLTVRLVCPPNDGSNDSLGRWTSYEVALTDGPHEVTQFAPGSPADVLAGCRDVVIVEFTLTAGNPFLYRDATSVLAATSLDG